MRLLFSYCLLLVSLAGFAQKSITTIDANPGNSFLMQLSERAKFEGLKLGSVGTYPASFTIGISQNTGVNGALLGNDITGVPIASSISPPVQMQYIPYITATTTDSASISAYVNPSTTSKGEPLLFKGTNTWNFNRPAFPNEGVGLNGWGTMGGRKTVVTWSFPIYRLSAYKHYGADKVVYLLCDSNGAAGAMEGITDPNDAFSWRLCNWLNSSAGAKYRNGREVRLVDKSLASQSTAYFDQLRKNSDLWFPQGPNYIIWALGTNNTDTTTYRAHTKAFIASKQAEYPNMTLTIAAPGPTSAGQSKEALMVNMRLCAQHIVNETKDPKVTYLNLGVAFPNTDDTYFSTNDGTNAQTRIHWNRLGHIKVFEAFRQHFIDNNIKL